MTASATEVAAPDGDDVQGEIGSDGDGSGRVERRRRAQRARRVSGAAYGLAVLLCAVAIPVLGYVGVQTVLDSSDGEVVDPVLDPSEPGYRALVPPSPTMLLVHTDADGAMAEGAVLTLAGEEAPGGSVMVFPSALAGDVPELGVLAIDGAFEFSGPDAALSAAQWALHLGIAEVVVMSDDDLAAMYAATGPLTIENPDEVELDDGTTFPSGSLTLEPAEIPLFTGHLDDDESRLNRVLRQQLVWDAWIEQLASTSSPVEFPGEQDSGLARFVGGIAGGTHRIESLPLAPDPEAEAVGGTAEFRLDDAGFQLLLPQLVPFPTGAADGDRPSVRILAGTEDAAALLPAARRAVMAGGQVDMIGNADEFGHEQTEIMYYDPARRADAEAVADALGFGTVVKVDEIDDTADIIVVLGSDADF